MPEEFYFETQLPIVTPENVDDWMQHMGFADSDLQERMSGSGRLSFRAFRQNVKVSFLVDYRYGWDMGISAHQDRLDSYRSKCNVGVTVWAPTCTPWSIASRHKDHDSLMKERAEQIPTIEYLIKDIKASSDRQQHSIVENPFNSDIWTKSPLAYLSETVSLRAFQLDQ